MDKRFISNKEKYNLTKDKIYKVEEETKKYYHVLNDNNEIQRYSKTFFEDLFIMKVKNNKLIVNQEEYDLEDFIPNIANLKHTTIWDFNTVSNKLSNLENKEDIFKYLWESVYIKYFKTKILVLHIDTKSEFILEYLTNKYEPTKLNNLWIITL